VNVDASITNVDAMALEILEKSPVVVIDKDGNISLKVKHR
jgi:iron complex outermembrane receptor protein